ncbi:MAG TPA: helix-turn-helix domain-containing protein [Ilumatobacteraceae bacterium]|nr:helix-turn-helix domain-containing protein [Ilumatobacteraceae bacterium]
MVDDWEPTGPTTSAELVLTDLDVLGEIVHPMRSRILRHLGQPHTAADLAALLDMPVTRLYHHLNRLEQVGLIHVVATRRVAAVTERRYQVVAQRFLLGRDLGPDIEPAEVALAIGSVFDFTKLQLQREIERAPRDRALPDLRTRSAISMSEYRVAPGRAQEFIDRVRALIDEFEHDYADGEPPETDPADRVALLIAAFPVTD